MFEDEGLLHRVPCAFLIIGGILGGLQVISFLIMRPKPFTDNVSEIESESTDSQRNKSDALDKERIEPELQPKQVLKIPDIYILWGIMFFSLFPLTLVQSAIKIIGQSATSDDAYLSIVATIGAVVNAVSRMTWGPVGDALSFKVPLCINSLIYATVLLAFPFVIAVPTAGKYLYAVWVVLLWFSIGGYFVLLPFAVSRAFGHKHFAANYGIVFTSFVPGGIIGAVIVATITLEYHTRDIFLVCGSTTLLVSVLACALKDAKAPSWCRRRWVGRKLTSIDAVAI